MAVRLSDKWLWDFWFAQDGSDYHIFYLQAPRSLGDPGLRHWHVSIGHAVSQDLINWELLPDALAPSSHEGAWDDFTTWTGNIIQHHGTWYMFYTGTNRAEKGLIQRIGLATSDDLIKWQRYPGNPIIEADPQWYEMLDLDIWFEQTWRDPWVFEHNGKFHVFVTARSNSGHKSSRGVIGYASSSDLFNWAVQAPVTEPGEFSYLEVPQLVQINDLWYLFFCVEHDKYSDSRRKRPGIKLQTGTHYLVSETPFGPFRFHSDTFLCGDEIGSLYSGKVLRNPKGKWVFMACKQFKPGGHFIGEIIDPLPIKVRSNAHIFISQ